MKKNIFLIMVLGIMAGNLFAQPVAQSQQPMLHDNNVQQSANAFERETTPLLREISRKKALLELRRLERELEKLEEERLKSEIERERLLSSARLGMPAAPQHGQQQMFTPMAFPPGALPNNMQQQQQSREDIRIVKIYGFEDNLMAKVSAGAVGGFIVQRGDHLPNNEIVLEVRPNHLTVGTMGDNNKITRVRRLFVRTVAASVGTNSTGPQGIQTVGSAGSVLSSNILSQVLTPIPPATTPASVR